MQFGKLPFIFVFAGIVRFATAETVWIDTDVSIGSPFREVDDAYAIVLALHSPEIRIAGISTSYGNAPPGHTAHAARALIQRFGASAGLTPGQVFVGARSARDLGQATAASDALARALENRSLTYIALGPLTNLATFLQLHPDVARKIRRIIFLGGRMEGTSLAMRPNGTFRIHDANVYKDPHAAAAIVGSNIPLTLVTIVTASNLILNEEDLRQLERQGGAGNYLSQRSQTWFWFWTHVVGTNGGPIFDAVASVAAVRPDLVTIKPGHAWMDGMGNLWVMRRLSAAATARSGLTSRVRPVRYCTGFAPRTKRFVMERLERLRGGE